MPIPALIGALGALAAGGLSHLSARSQQQRAIDAQRSMQTMLLNNSGSIMARNARQAGLSPAFALGSSGVPTAPSVASPSANFDSSGLQSLLGGINMRKLQKQQSKTEQQETRVQEANADIAEQKAEQERIITAKMKGESGAFAPTSPNYVDENGEVVVVGNRMPSISGAYEQGYQQGELKKAEMSLQKQGFSVQSIKYDIEEGVYNRQKGDERILDAIAREPVAKIEQLQAHAQELLAAARSHDASALLSASQKAYVDIEKEFMELKKNEYASGSVDALFKNFSIENFFKWFLRNLLDVVNLGGNISKKF